MALWTLFLVGVLGVACGYYLARHRRPVALPDGGRSGAADGEESGHAPDATDEADSEDITDDADGNPFVAVWSGAIDDGTLTDPDTHSRSDVSSEGNSTPSDSSPVAAVWPVEDDIDPHYRTLAENFPDGSLALFDEDGHYLLSGGQLYRYIDYEPEDFVGHTVEESYAQQFVDQWADRFDAVFEGEESTFEFRHEDRYYRKHLVPVWDDDGTVEVGMEITKDITDVRERERALRESEKRYRTLAENFPGGALTLFDRDRRYHLVGGRLFEHIEQDPEDFVGHTIDEAFRETYVERFGGRYDAVFEGTDSTFEFRHGDRYYRKHLVPVWDDDGETVDVGMEITHDVTELRERERELERQNERLEEFVGMVSHDLRNPIQVLRGRLQLLDDEVDSEHLDRARDATDRMETLIGDMLALARQGESVTDPKPVPLVRVAHDAWGTADTKDATLSVAVEDAVVEAEPNRLRQLLENCYRNAVDHGPDDVTVTVGALEDRPGFYVADDGPGVPPEQREKVFEHGYSGGDGTGFGLAIVSEIADAHGWEVDIVASDAGGARFEFQTGR